MTLHVVHHPDLKRDTTIVKAHAYCDDPSRCLTGTDVHLEIDKPFERVEEHFVLHRVLHEISKRGWSVKPVQGGSHTLLCPDHAPVEDEWADATEIEGPDLTGVDELEPSSEINYSFHCGQHSCARKYQVAALDDEDAETSAFIRGWRKDESGVWMCPDHAHERRAVLAGEDAMRFDRGVVASYADSNEPGVPAIRLIKAIPVEDRSLEEQAIVDTRAEAFERIFALEQTFERLEHRIEATNDRLDKFFDMAQRLLDGRDK